MICLSDVYLCDSVTHNYDFTIYLCYICISVIVYHLDTILQSIYMVIYL